MAGSGRISHYIQWIAEEYNGRAVCTANYMPDDVIVINNSADRVPGAAEGRDAEPPYIQTYAIWSLTDNLGSLKLFSLMFVLYIWILLATLSFYL